MHKKTTIVWESEKIALSHKISLPVVYASIWTVWRFIVRNEHKIYSIIFTVECESVCIFQVAKERHRERKKEKNGFPVVLRFHSGVFACDPQHNEWINERLDDDKKNFCRMSVCTISLVSFTVSGFVLLFENPPWIGKSVEPNINRRSRVSMQARAQRFKCSIVLCTYYYFNTNNMNWKCTQLRLQANYEHKSFQLRHTFWMREQQHKRIELQKKTHTNTQAHIQINSDVSAWTSKWREREKGNYF